MEFVKQYKLRKIAECPNGEEIYGFTVPKKIREKFRETFFFIEIIETKLIFVSGCKLSPEEMEKRNRNYDFAR